MAVLVSKNSLVDSNGMLLAAGQVAKCRAGSLVQNDYYVGIKENYTPLTNGVIAPLQTFIPDKGSALIWPYWSKRLTVVGDMESHGHLLENQIFVLT